MALRRGCAYGSNCGLSDMGGSDGIHQRRCIYGEPSITSHAVCRSSYSSMITGNSIDTSRRASDQGYGVSLELASEPALHFTWPGPIIPWRTLSTDSGQASSGTVSKSWSHQALLRLLYGAIASLLNDHLQFILSPRLPVILTISCVRP
ncbi:hypothetical protein DENSPDRAFT_628463 [Dentipellis sp. KUC8613]|nr:hypothetical protein DENSPDRAFT_628463 [Dentipellis sp. KUC8613]